MLNNNEGPSDFFSHEVAFGGEFLPEGFVHLDYAASTPLHVAVFEAMEPWLFSYFGNPAAGFHAMGKLAMHALAQARETAAEALCAPFEQVYFTGSATESNNLLLRGLVESRFRSRTDIVYAATEHASVATTAQALERNFGSTHGIRAIVLPVDGCGQVCLDEARRLISEKTLCVCVMDVNNETGIVQGNLERVIEMAHKVGAPVHVDSVQGFARGPFATRNLNWDSITLSSGKIYGPRGAALLATRNSWTDLMLEPQLTGGGHEFGMRSSTVNVAAVVGFVKALKMQIEDREERNNHLLKMERLFLETLREKVDAVEVHCGAERVPGIVSLVVDRVNPLKLVEKVPRVAVGAGSACRALHANASHVLLAMGLPLEEAMNSFRVSLGLPTTESEAREGALLIAAAARALQLS